MAVLLVEHSLDVPTIKFTDEIVEVATVVTRTITDGRTMAAESPVT
jgi:hypothetical protein